MTEVSGWIFPVLILHRGKLNDANLHSRLFSGVLSRHYLPHPVFIIPLVIKNSIKGIVNMVSVTKNGGKFASP